MDSIVSVIVPIYRGLESTRRCIESVLQTPQETDYELILIDDASPEPELAAWLDELASARPVRLIRHETNLGFVSSVNEGIALSPGRDVVLLNSDTEVAGAWLDRLSACARGVPAVATVTPFSNNATICSYPRIAETNPLSPGLSVGELDALFASTNLGAFVELPTGVGFCLYITARAIAEVGLLDAERFGHGYGEEVDFCLRARALGLRNLLCGDTFVYHQGRVSFGDASEARIRAAQAIVDADFPEYPTLVQDFIRRDAARPLRRAVDLARLAASPLPRILFVSHAWGGGVERHVRDLVLGLTDRAEVLLLQPHEADRQRLTWAREGEEFAAYYDLRSDLTELIDLLRRLGVARVHFHHLQGMPSGLLDLPRQLGVPHDFTLHDYFSVCPQFYFADAEGRYCGEPDEDTCRGCLAGRPPQWNLTIAQWRRAFVSCLESAERVIAPTQDVAARMARYAPDVAFQVWPHPDLEEPLPLVQAPGGQPVRRVLVLGALSDAKGLDLVSRCATLAARDSLPLHLRVIGSIARPVPVWPEANLSVLGEYDEERLPEILRLERPDAFLFASRVPETYSYTLTVAMATGLPIVATSIGAFPERLSGYPGAALLDPARPTEDWLEALLAPPASYAPNAQPLGMGRGKDRTRAYLDAYLEPIRPMASTDATVTAPAHHYYLPDLARRPTPPLEVLYEQGVVCGKREAANALQHGVVEATERLGAQLRQLTESQAALTQSQAALAGARRMLAESQQQAKGWEALALRLEGEVGELKGSLSAYDEAHNRHVTHLEHTIDGLRYRIVELEQSTSWRVTAPLRWVVHRAKQLVLGVQSAPRTLPRAAARARQIVADEGVRGLVDETRKRAQARWEAGRPEPERPRYELESEIAPLQLPASPDPEVTILIPTYGEHLSTYTCLKSIAENTQGVSFEVLVVDDCFAEPAAEALAAVSGVRFLRNEHNLGFLRTCNRGAAEARGRYLLLLNNDTLVLPGWLDALLRLAKRGDDIGAVGAKLLFPDGRLQEAGGIVWRDASGWNWGRGQDPDDPRFQYVRQVDYCSAACLLLPSALFAELGGFDERYAPAYFEDTDLCFALRARGKRVLYQPAARIVHFEGVSHGTDESAGLKAYQTRNQTRFQEKWASQLAHHLPNAVMPERERDRGVRQRVLWVEACMLTPDKDSGSVRTWRLLEILQQMGCKVTFVADNLQHEEPYTTQLQQQGVEVLYHPYVRSVEAYLREQAAHHDLIVLCRHYIARNYVHLIREIAPAVKIAFDTIDLHYLRLRRKAELDGLAATRRAAEQAFNEELDVMANSDATLVVSPEEQQVLAREIPQARVHILSNVHEPIAHVPPFEARSDVLFIGGFQHPPNIDAVEYYAQEIWPLFQAAHPGVRTLIVGSRMPASLKALGEAAGLTMLGYVPDVEPLLASARLTIAPLRYGAGVKGKVNQSMSHGVPVVASAVAAEGMGLIDGEDVLIAAEPHAFAQAMGRLYTDAALWSRLSQAGQQNVQRHFSSDAARTALAALFDSLGLPLDGA